MHPRGRGNFHGVFMNRVLRFVGINAITALIQLMFILPCHAEVLYVFIPTIHYAKMLEKELGTALPNVEIKVYARYKDFKSKVESAPPDAILTKNPVVKTYRTSACIEI